MTTPFSKIPTHLAVIMDGNGRWAKQRGLPRILGHRQGVKAVRSTVQTSREIGIQVLTLFAFSQENWQRPAAEVNALMDLLHEYLDKECEELMQNNISLRAIGDTSRLPSKALKRLQEVIAVTSGNQGMILNLALSYGGRNEIVRAAQHLARRCLAQELTPEQIDEQCFSQALWTAGLPDPDLIIRTSGELRLSNFLLFQAAYAELYVTPVLWPDFDRDELLKALADYERRNRRFGRVSD